VPEIKVGDLYEDCGYHPVLCTHVDEDDDGLTGISLIDAGSRSCSANFCGVVPLTIEQVLEARSDFEGYMSRRIAEDKRLAAQETQDNETAASS
jgi:hypothetical protein